MKQENHGSVQSSNITTTECVTPSSEPPVATTQPGSPSSIPDAQVKTGQRATRRKFSVVYKVKILAQYEACSNALARGELLRKEGLYHSRLTAWRKQGHNGRLSAQTSGKNPKSTLINQELARENARLKKQLTQAHAIIEIQKKVSELLGMHIPLTDNSETS